MRITVVVPAYNRADTVGRALRSILEQTLPPAEVVVVDDGSMDGTAAAVRAFGEAVHYVRQENAGVSAARNTGILLASSEWIAFLDSDDEWLPDKLARQAAILQRHPELAWCSTSGWLVVEDRPINHPVGVVNEAELRRQGYFSSYFDAARRGAWFHTCGMMIRKRVFDEVGKFDPSLVRSEDLDLWWRIAMRYPCVGYDAESLFSVHAGSHNSLVCYADPSKRTCLNVLCRNMARARDLSEPMGRKFRQFGLPQVVTYAIKTAAGEAKLTQEEIGEALDSFRADWLTRWFVGLVYRLPYRLARLMRRIQEDIWQPLMRRNPISW